MLVLDTAALLALERNDRSMWVRLKTCQWDGLPPVTHGGVIGEAWRGGPDQTRLAAAIAGMDIMPLDGELGRAAGALLGRATGAPAGRTDRSDVIDAALALLADDGDTIVTEDTEELAELLAATGRRVELLRP